MEAELALAQRVAIVFLNLSVASLVGAAVASAWLRGAGSAWAAGLVPRLRRAMLACVPVAIAAYVVVLWLEAASMAEVPLAEALPAVQSVLTATHYGTAWMLGAAALVATGLLSALRPGALAARLATLGLFLYSRSIVSHAGAAGDFTWAVAFDWLHFVLVSLWVGEVLVAGLVTLRSAPREPAARMECARYVEALSHSATIALVGLFVTGALGAWRGLGSLDNAFGNPYADTLLVKLALVLCAAALGGLNRFLVMPQLLAGLRGAPGHGTEDKATRKFTRILQIEAMILVAALVAAAFLSSTPPPTAA